MSEYKTILQCTKEVEIALESDKDILNFLDREGFIKPSIYEDVSNPKSLLSASEKAGLLVTGIKNKVRLNPKNYHKLMRHFHQDRRLYGDIADILDEEYRKQGGVPEEVHPPAEGASSQLTCKRQRVLQITTKDVLIRASRYDTTPPSFVGIFSTILSCDYTLVSFSFR